MSKVSLIVGFDNVPSSRALGSLHRKFGVRQEEKLELINGYTVKVPQDRLDEYVSSLPDSAKVMADESFFHFPKKDHHGDEEQHSERAVPYLSRPLGMTEIHAQGLTGKGSTIAVVDSGLVPHKDFGERIKLFKDFGVNAKRTPYDHDGHGTHVAGIAVGDGEEVDGVAPGAELVALRITSALEAIKAISWAVDHKDELGINILNISLGVADRLPAHQDPFAQATQKAIDAGILTVVAAGNEGNKCGTTPPCRRTISSPGTLPAAITVGAYSDAGTLDSHDDFMLQGSSVGPTAIEGNPKPDLVGPGWNILSTTAPDGTRSSGSPSWQSYHFDGGSSASTPMVAGALALLREIEPGLTQEKAQKLLRESSTPIQGVEAAQQGAGRLNLTELIRLQGAHLRSAKES